MSDDLQALLQAVRSEQRSALWFAVPALVVAAGLVVMWIGVRDPMPAVVAVVFAATGAGLLRHALRDPRAAPIARAIVERPGAIRDVEVRYIVHGVGRPVPRLHVTLDDGRSHFVYLDRGTEKDLLARIRARIAASRQRLD